MARLAREVGAGPGVQDNLNIRIAAASTPYEVMAAVWTSVVEAQVRNGNHIGPKGGTLDLLERYYAELAATASCTDVRSIQSVELERGSKPDPILCEVAEQVGICSVSAMFPPNTIAMFVERDNGLRTVEAIVSDKNERVWVENGIGGAWISNGWTISEGMAA